MSILHIDWHCLCGDAAASHVSRPEGEECHGWCQRTERDCKGKGYRPIAHTERTPAISAIFDAAGSRFLPKYWTCDLSSDYRTLIAADAPRQFIWLLRTSGTELYRLGDDDEPLTVQAGLAGLRYWTSEREGHADTLVFHWNGSALVEIPAARAEEVMQAHIAAAV